MTAVRIALANLRFPSNAEEAASSAVSAIEQAADEKAGIICFPECFIPGYRWLGEAKSKASEAALREALDTVASAARRLRVTTIMGIERITDRGLQIAACVIDAEREIVGWQDKVQLDPSEESVYPAMGRERRIFTSGPLTFGVVICHEGWRYPETVRWAARRGAQIVFHPHASIAEPGSFRPTEFADPLNSFHEKAILCRAAENSCYFASVNYASEGSPTTSAVARPDGSLLCWQPYGLHGLLLADIDLPVATGLLASRCRTSPL